MLFYRVALPLSRRTLNYTAGDIRRHRIAIGSAWRRLSPAQQALLVPVHLFKGETFDQVTSGFGVDTATAWRYVHETTGLLAHRAPTLEQALRRALRAGHAFVVLDGTLIACDRLAADRSFYSGKHKHHGMNVQVVSAPGGSLLWASWFLSGAVHDVRVAWGCRVAERIAAAGLVALADKGRIGLSDAVFCPFRNRGKPQWKKGANSEHTRFRSPGERAIAQVKNWRILLRLRCCPQRAGEITRAVLVLQLRETG